MRLYDSFPAEHCAGEIDLVNMPVAVTLCDSSYEPDTGKSTPNALSGIIATAPLTGRTFVGGVFDADDVSFEFDDVKEPKAAVVVCNGCLVGWEALPGEKCTGITIRWSDKGIIRTSIV